MSAAGTCPRNSGDVVLDSIAEMAIADEVLFCVLTSQRTPDQRFSAVQSRACKPAIAFNARIAMLLADGRGTPRGGRVQVLAHTRRPDRAARGAVAPLGHVT